MNALGAALHLGCCAVWQVGVGEAVGASGGDSNQQSVELDRSRGLF